MFDHIEPNLPLLVLAIVGVGVIFGHHRIKNSRTPILSVDQWQPEPELRFRGPRRRVLRSSIWINWIVLIALILNVRFFGFGETAWVEEGSLMIGITSLFCYVIIFSKTAKKQKHLLSHGEALPGIVRSVSDTRQSTRLTVSYMHCGREYIHTTTSWTLLSRLPGVGEVVTVLIEPTHPESAVIYLACWYQIRTD